MIGLLGFQLQHVDGIRAKVRVKLVPKSLILVVTGTTLAGSSRVLVSSGRAEVSTSNEPREATFFTPLIAMVTVSGVAFRLTTFK